MPRIITRLGYGSIRRYLEHVTEIRESSVSRAQQSAYSVEAMSHQSSVTESQIHPRLYRPGQWPGERRHPSRWDVHDAINIPATTFLERFRVALLHSEAAAEDVFLDPEPVTDAPEIVAVVSRTDCWLGMSTDFPLQDSASPYSYPMVMLSDLPELLPDKSLSQLQALFFESFGQHIFLKTVRISNWCSGRPPLYFQYALACLGSTVSASPLRDIVPHGMSRAELSSNLFVSSSNVWVVMLEVDNRESRLCEAVITVGLFVDEPAMRLTLAGSTTLHFRDAFGRSRASWKGIGHALQPGHGMPCGFWKRPDADCCRCRGARI
jgi:hypothetical protein